MNNNKKKVLHLIDSGGLYGAESVILNLSREMISHKAYEPIIGCIVASKHESNELFDKANELKISAVKIPILNSRLFVDIPKAARLIKQLGVDLIHSHGYKAFVFGFFIKMIKHIPIISTCHLWFLKNRPPLKMRAMVKMELFLYKFCSKICCVSGSIKNFLSSVGINPNKIIIVNNGIKIDDYRPCSASEMYQLRISIGLEENNFIILNIGRLTAQKAQKNIIKAAGILRNYHSRYRFLLVGEGELKSELEALIIAQNLQEIVKLLGFRDDIRQLLCIADIFVLPSIDEGMPMSLLEAVACKKPVIATGVGDIPKLIVHEKSGIIVPINDKYKLVQSILNLEKNYEKGRRLADSAFNILCQKYSSTQMYKKYDKVYIDFLNLNNTSCLK